MQHVAYDALARAAGYSRTHRFDNMESFAIEIERILAASGPVLTWLKIVPDVENRPIKQRSRWQTRARDQVVADFRREFGVDSAGKA